jgi:molybdopterin molybdotransferase
MGSATTHGSTEDGRVMGFDEALATVLGYTARLPRPARERVSLTESLGRVLAEEIKADRDQPAFDRSTRDGFAVHANDAGSGRWLRVVGQVAAGGVWQAVLGENETAEIMTGAPVPEDADAVVMLEHVERNSEGSIRLAEGRTVRRGENVVTRGSEARAGDVVLPEGAEMDAAAIALAAGCGVAEVAVFRRPRVSILATGDELVDVTESPGPSQIRNSNSYGLEALVTRAGGNPLRLPVARDQRNDLRSSLLEARKADLLLISGGVSMGEYDLVEEVLRELGAEFFFTGVRMQPGRPLVFGRLPAKDGKAEVYLFGHPGNPVSTQATFACFVEPMLRAMRGAPVEGPRFSQATLAEAVAGRPALTRVLPARLTANRQRPEVRLVPWQGSGDMAAQARANCYAILPEGAEGFEAGEVITVLLR